MATKTNQSADTKPTASLQSNISLLPTLYMKMDSRGSKQRDPIQRVEKDMTAFNPDIDNNGGSLYNSEEFSIVCRFKTSDELERDHNEDCGLGDVTNSEAYILQETSFYSEYEYEDARNDFLEANYDDSWKYDKETYSRYGTNSDEYIDMVASGEVIDADGMCKMNPAKIGASVTEEDINAAKEDYNEDLTAEADADVELESAELSTETSPARGDTPEAESSIETDSVTPPTSTPITSAAASNDAPAIESDVKLSSQFAKATSPQIPEPEAATPEPTTITPAPAANNPSYQMSA